MISDDLAQRRRCVKCGHTFLVCGPSVDPDTRCPECNSKRTHEIEMVAQNTDGYDWE